jgi:hypothetical protein
MRNEKLGGIFRSWSRRTGIRRCVISGEQSAVRVHLSTSKRKRWSCYVLGTMKALKHQKCNDSCTGKGSIEIGHGKSIFGKRLDVSNISSSAGQRTKRCTMYPKDVVHCITGRTVHIIITLVGYVATTIVTSHSTLPYPGT